MSEILTREQVKEQYTWNMEDMYATNEDWEKDYESSFQEMNELESYKGKLSSSEQVLAEFLGKYAKLAEKVEKIHVYANQRYHQDTGNSFYQDLADRASNVDSRFESKTGT